MSMADLESSGGGLKYTDFVVETYTSSAVTIPNLNSMYSTNFTQTKSGYYPIGIVGSGVSKNSNDLTIKNLRATSRDSGTATFHIDIKNTSTSAVTNLIYYVDILWIKI